MTSATALAHGAALASVFLALLAAPLVIGARAALQGADRRGRLLWLGLAAGLLGLALVAGALAVVVLLVA